MHTFKVSLGGTRNTQKGMVASLLYSSSMKVYEAHGPLMKRALWWF